MAVFSAFMAVLYFGVGIFLIVGDKKFMNQLVNPTMMVIFGVVLLFMGVLRGLRAYQLFKIYRDAN